MLFTIFDWCVRLVFFVLSVALTVFGFLVLLVTVAAGLEDGTYITTALLSFVQFIAVCFSALLGLDCIRGKFFELDLTRL